MQRQTTHANSDQVNRKKGSYVICAPLGGVLVDTIGRCVSQLSVNGELANISTNRSADSVGGMLANSQLTYLSIAYRHLTDTSLILSRRYIFVYSNFCCYLSTQQFLRGFGGFHQPNVRVSSVCAIFFGKNWGHYGIAFERYSTTI